MNALKIIWRHRRILWATTLTDIKGRFQGTLLGMLWTVVYPILFLGLYAVVYTMIFRIKVASFTTTDYVLLIFCGLVPFLGFSEALGTGVTSVTSNKSLIKNTLFPIELIPAKAVLSSSVTMVVGLLLLLGVLWSKGIVHAAQLAIPLILVLQILFTIGLIWLLSAINVFVSDLGQIMAIVILFLMLVSPIAYTHDMIPAGLLPFMYPNPLYYLIMLYRDAAFFGVIDPVFLGTFALITTFVVLVGGFAFSRLKPIFADYV
jgi:lipopolysaccharide transport system permease protein